MMKAVGKVAGRFIIGSGQGVNPGRLAGGALGIQSYENKKGWVFGKRSEYSNLSFAPRPGGLIDKRQQNDPSSTVFGHPFDNGEYRSTATRPQKKPRTSFTLVQSFNPLTQYVPEIMPHERGRFFESKPVAVVKTQGGANQTGAKSDTAFHPQTRRVIQNSEVRGSLDSAKLVNARRPPSFATTGNLWSNSNHSFISGRPNTVSGDIGKGRWETVKRSVV